MHITSRSRWSAGSKWGWSVGTPRSFPAESQTDDTAVYHEGSLGLRGGPVSWDGGSCLSTSGSALHCAAVGNVSGALGKLAAQPLLAAKAGLASELPSLTFVRLLLFLRLASTSPMCNWTVMGSRWRCLKSGSRQTSHWTLTLNSDCESYPTSSVS